MITATCDGFEVQMKQLFFPGGEPHVEISGLGIADGNVRIDARIGTAAEFMLLLAVTDAFRRMDPGEIHLFLPYVPGARQDREEPGFAFTAEIYADLINRQEYDSVTVVDPHSDVAPSLLKNVKVLDIKPLIDEYLKEVNASAILCPDAGAKHRCRLQGEYSLLPVIYCEKKRNPRTGKLSGFTAEEFSSKYKNNLVIVDDICDGGGTFLGLANHIRENVIQGLNIHLWTTHGIYSQGLGYLGEKFRTIGCTDSFPTSTDLTPRVEQFKLEVPK